MFTRIDRYTFYFFIALGIFSSFLIFLYFPLSFLDSIYTKYQDPLFMDQNFYAYHARRLCHVENLTIEDFNVTWSSFGVMSYLTYACKLTSYPMGYIFFNIIFFILSLSIFIKSLTVALKKDSLNFSFITALLIPVSIYYVSLPGKEIFSYCGAFIFCSGIIYLKSKKFLKGASYILISIIVVSVSRPHEGFALFLLTMIFLTNIKITIFRFLFYGAIFSFIFEALILLLVNTFFNTEFVSIIDMLGFKSELDQYLSNENIIIHFILGPIRVIVICLGTLLTSILPLFDILKFDISFYLYKSVPLFLRFIEMFAAITAFIILLKNTHPNTKIILTIFLYYIFFVTFFGIEQRTRYLFAVFPILIIYCDQIIYLHKSQVNQK